MKSCDQRNDMKLNRQSRSKIDAGISAQRLRFEAGKCQRYQAIRLLALADIADGECYDAVAKRYRVSKSTITNWVQRLNERGIEAFSRRHRPGRKCHLRNRDSVGFEELAVAAKAANEHASKKLMAIARLLEQVPCGEVARDANIPRSTLTAWIKKFNKGGIAGLIANKRLSFPSRIVMRRDISAVEVREIARTAPPRTSRRFLAVAQVLDGKKLADVAETFDVSTAAVSTWCKQFNQDGMEGLVDRWEKKTGRALATTIKLRNSWPS
ncbi:MAG: helix-turn-helix domain-containing protein [Geminicoccaceae bacterium]